MTNYYNTNIGYFTEYNEWLMDHLTLVNSDHIEFGHVGEDIFFKQSDEQGNEFFTSSVYDPQYEATQFLDGVNFDNTGYILLGMGSSAIIKQILENKTETAWLLIIEKDAAIVKKFLEEVDLSSYLEGRLQRIIILTESMDNLTDILNSYINSAIGYYLLQTDILRTFACYRRDQDFYDMMVAETINYIRTHVTAMGNSMEDTYMGMTNELKNVPIALTSHRVKELKDKYQGKPVICVASGPSLDKQLPLLKDAKGKALIICAESAFRVLLKNGISPDIVCILERGPNSFDLSVQGLDIPVDTALVGLTLMDPRLPRNWNSYVIPVFKKNIVHSRLLNDALGDLGTLYNGSSVAHMNYSVAQYMGGYPIIFIGQDLAYSDEGVTHSKHSLYVDQSDVEMSIEERNQIKESFQEDANFFNRTVFVDGYYGAEVKTREIWRQFLHWMEHIIRAEPAPLVINATEGGASIRGTVQMPFKEVIEQYCSNPIMSIPELFSSLPMASSKDEVKENLQGMIEFLDEQLGKVESIGLFAEEILAAAQVLQSEMVANPDNSIENIEIKAGRILRNVELLIKDVLKDTFITFLYRPLISNYHVKMNPISRVSSRERFQTILIHQTYLLKRIVGGKKQVFDIYDKGIREAVLELEYDPEELYLDAKAKWEFPEWEEGEED